jgi:hypothetical protein
MKKGIVLSVIAIVLLSLMATATLPKSAHEADEIGAVIVHEWGTFTSIAGEHGEPIVWRTYGGSADLPCFVNTFGGFKPGLSGNVRMETPVLYFYGPREFSANVRVRFAAGKITEWYPNASVGNAYDAIEWRNIRVTPDSTAGFPTERGRSHYYAARETNAAPLSIGSQREKFLFYRGVGTLPLPISTTVVADGRVVVKNVGAEPVSGVVLFENRKGIIRYKVAGVVEKEVFLDSERSRGYLSGLLAELEDILVGQGLFREEAKAMIETWRDSWFEEGTRVFYIVPRSSVDSILPLEIQPAPSKVARVFVGRMEAITPGIQEDVKRAIANNDRVTLEKYGRFLEPIARRIGLRSALLDAVYSGVVGQVATCGR